MGTSTVLQPVDVPMITKFLKDIFVEHQVKSDNSVEATLSSGEHARLLLLQL